MSAGASNSSTASRGTILHLALLLLLLLSLLLAAACAARLLSAHAKQYAM
jgi:hypothetical protein